MKHFKFKTLLAMLIFITMSSLIVANGTFIVLTNNMVSLTGENGDISIIVNDGQGKTYEMMGDIGDDIEAAYGEGVTGIFSTNRVAVPYKEARLRAKSDMKLTMDNILRFMKSMGVKA